MLVLKMDDLGRAGVRAVGCWRGLGGYLAGVHSVSDRRDGSGRRRILHPGRGQFHIQMEPFFL